MMLSSGVHHAVALRETLRRAHLGGLRWLDASGPFPARRRRATGKQQEASNVTTSCKAGNAVSCTVRPSSTSEKASGEFLINQARLVATEVERVVVGGAGHWLMEEATDRVVPMPVEFLNR